MLIHAFVKSSKPIINLKLLFFRGQLGTYSISSAIDSFLSDVYAPSAMDGRYDYIPADSQAGVVLYDDKFAYSHHASDPACGKLLNAFDIVRVHRFGDKDAGGDDSDPTKLPSFRAMQELASKDEGL